MNYWIEGTPDELREVLKRVDILIINDSEARELSREANLVKAARVLQGDGAGHGGHQAGRARRAHDRAPATASSSRRPRCRWRRSSTPPAPATPSRAASWATWPGAASHATPPLARAIIYGSTLASFAVEDFSIDRLLRLTQDEIAERFRHFKRLTHFDEA